MFLLWILLICYILLIVYRLYSPDSKLTWDKLTLPPIHNTECLKDSDCQSTEVCLSNQCIQKYRGVTECNPHTGTWEKKQLGTKTFATCKCKYPQLISQAWEGSNCNVGKACGPHGRLKDVTVNPLLNGKCECDFGYYEDESLNRFKCQKMLPYWQFKPDCEEDEVSRYSNYFAREYINSFPNNIQCFKNPCVFNVLNGKRLRHTHFDPNVGCICNPARGNFGVKFDNFTYLNTPGYHGCANIYENEPETDLLVKLYTYYYIKDSEPISFLSFEKIKKDNVVESLRNYVNHDRLQIADDWRYGFTQHILNKNTFYVHTRKCWTETLFNIYKYDENLILKNHMIDCQNISDHISRNAKPFVNTYNLLYKFPVCKFNDPSNTKYHGTVILNPFLLSHQKYPHLFRSNGISIIKHLDGWYVDLAESDFDTHKLTAEYPSLENALTRSL